jgi:putative endonuclease
VAKNFSQKIGQLGEQLACRYLETKRYKILAKNDRIPGGEIDLITQKGLNLVFFEIKTRQSHRFGEMEEAISKFQKNALLRTANNYLEKQKTGSSHQTFHTVQFDLLAIEIKIENNKKIAYLKHYQNIFLE